MREEVGGFVYILASARNGTLHTGSAPDLLARTYEHREGLFHLLPVTFLTDASRTQPRP